MAGFFDTLFGGGAEREAADRNRQVLAQYQGQGLDALSSAYGQSTGYGQQGVSAYDPLAALGQKYSSAQQLQLDAIGANGPAGTERARVAMQATPGYAAGIEAVRRSGALNNSLNSGGTNTDLVDYATNKVYAPWLQNVTGAAQMGGQYTAGAAQGRAGQYDVLANLANQYGTNQAGIYGNVAQGNIASNNLQAAGEAAGARNLFGAGLGLASLFTGGAGGGLGSSLIQNTLGSAIGPSGAGQWYSPYYGPARG